MEELDIPIFAKVYALYKSLCSLRNGVPKNDRHGLWLEVEKTTLSVIELLYLAGQRTKDGKFAVLEQASVRLNLLRMLIRLAKDTSVIQSKQYIQIQQNIDEIGRMLGGWIKSVKASTGTPPPRGIFEEMKERGRKCQRDGTPLFGFASSFQLLTLRPSALNLTLTRWPSAVRSVCLVPS